MRERVRVGFDFGDEVSRTKQASKDETDINLMIRRHGVIPAPVGAGNFVDVSMVEDYFSSMQIVARAQESFARLPAVVRERFDNDPGALVRTVDAALGDPEGHKALVSELVDLDLLAPEVLERFGVPAEPGDSPVPVPSPPAPSPPPPES